MKFLIVFSAVVAAVLGYPGLLLGGEPTAALAPVTYARLVSGAPLGLDGRVVDTPEVTVAKVQHAAAQVNERVVLANEALKSAEAVVVPTPTVGVVATGFQPVALATTNIVPGAPIGVDGRVVDTPEVSLAKAEHAVAQVNERINLAREAAKSNELPILVSSSFRLV